MPGQPQLAGQDYLNLESEQLLDNDTRWVEEYPGEAGSIYGTCQTSFDDINERQQNDHRGSWAPFYDEAEWELAEWLMTSGISEGAKPTFHNARSLLKKIDELPGGPDWECKVIEITGDEKNSNNAFQTEEVEVWMRDPVKCIEELLENPFIGKNNGYVPIRVYRDNARTNREYGEACTGDWMWDTQVNQSSCMMPLSLTVANKNKLPPGATIVPVILSSDKTSLTNFSGDKQAYPIYVATGTTEQKIRRQPSAHGTVLIGYLPVSKMECFSEARRSAEIHQLFHECMRMILSPLVEAGTNGVKMRCADGFIRKVYLIVAAYIADYPEQCLVVGCKENACPKCTVDPKQRGDPIHSMPHDPKKTLRILKQKEK
ncbi:hypothetical protein C0992_006739, partial [Termitomyces sp. T32_za158]